MPTDWNLADSLGPAPRLWLPPTAILQTAGVATGWTDKSGASNPISVATAGPTVGVLQNGLNGVTFNGTTQLMSQPASPANPMQKIITDPFQFHAFAIVKPVGAGGVDVINPYNNPGLLGDSTGRWGLFYSTVAGTDSIQAQTFTGASVFASAVAPRGSVYLVEWWLDPSDQKVRIRINAGAAAASAALGAAMQIASMDTLRLGEGINTQFASCVVGEVFVSSRMLNTNGQKRARADIASRWRQAA